MSRRLSASVFAIALILSVVTFAQGVGTPGANGLVPSVEIGTTVVGSTTSLTLEHAAGMAPALLVVSPLSAPLPLAAFGLGPAVLGPDLSASLLADGLQTDAHGALTIPVYLDPALDGWPLHAQFLVTDAGAPHGGVALSTHGAWVFGDRHEIMAAATVGAAGVTLNSFYADGQPAGLQDVRLVDVLPLGLQLANSNQLAPSRSDQPVTDPLHAFAASISMPDGSRLFGVQSLSDESGIVRVTAEGRVEVLAWSSVVLEPTIAVSAHDPWFAFVRELESEGEGEGGAALDHGGAQLILGRLDGQNISGASNSVAGVLLPFEVESSSLCFLDGALFVSDGSSQVARIDLTTLVATPVVFGGSTITYVDETAAPAADGSALAMGAGASETVHDLWLVTADGIATNVTQAPSFYHDANLADPEGIQLALNADGTQMAYVETTFEPATFIRDTQAPFTMTHVTPLSLFVNYIDTVVGLRYTPDDFVVFNAGVDQSQTDVYAVKVTNGAMTDFANLTGTAVETVPPFGPGDLELTRSFDNGDTTFAEMAFPNGDTCLQAIDSQGVGTGFLMSDIIRVKSLGTRTLFIEQLPSGQIRVRVIETVPTPTLAWEWTSTGASTLAAIGADATDAAGIVVVTDMVGTHILCLNATPSAMLTPFASMNGRVDLRDNGDVFVTVPLATGGVTVHRLEAATGVWAQEFTFAVPTLLLR